MTERMEFVVRWSRDEGNFAGLCREFGISRKTGYKWLDRFEASGPGGLEDRPSIPREPALKTPDAVADRLVLARKGHPSWGPRKLRAWLGEREPDLDLPAWSTIGEILKRRGLVRPRKRRLRVPIERLPLAECAGPNEIWSADFKGNFLLGDRSRCYPVTIADVYSRYFLKCEGLPEPKELPVREHFELAFTEFGLPFRIRTDNGVPFASTAPGGLTALVVWWIKLGIVPERIEPGHPEQNGRHERLHRTLKEEATKPPERDLAAQQRRFDYFRREYNEERPHEALQDQPPSRVYALSLRSYPAKLSSPDYPADFELRRIDSAGRLAWRGETIKLPICLAGEPVGLRETDDRRWELHYGPLVLGLVDGRGANLKLVRAEATKPPDSGYANPGPGDPPADVGEKIPGGEDKRQQPCKEKEESCHSTDNTM